MKITGVIFNQPVQIGNHIDKHLMSYSLVDGKPIKLDLTSANQFISVEWSTSDGLPMVNYIPMANVNSIISEVEKKKTKEAV